MDATVAQPSCLTCCHRETTEWCGLERVELERVERAKTRSDYAPGTVIYDQGEDCNGLFCLKSGLVGIRRLDENGNSTLLRLACPGETLGYRSFLTKAPHQNCAEVLMPSSVCRIDPAAVRRLLQDNPEFGLAFLNHSLRDLNESENRYMESVTWKAKTRLLHLLMVLNERYGIETENGEHHLELPISRQDLAGLIGTAPETMSRMIHRIQAEGLVRFDGRMVRIFNLAAMCRDMPLDS